MSWGTRIRGGPQRGTAIEPSSLSLVGFVLVVLLASMGSAGAASSPEAGELPRTAPVELAQLRTAKSETYLQPDGSLKTIISSLPIHYRDGARGWRKIRNELVESGRADFRWSNREAGFKVDLKEAVREGVVRFEAGDARFTLTLEGATPSAGARRSETAKEASSGVVYENVLAQTDLEYVLLPTGLKETLVLKRPGAPNEFVFRVESLEGSRFTLERRRDGGIDVRTPGAAEPAAVISAPIVNDSRPITISSAGGSVAALADSLPAAGKASMGL